MKSVALRAVLVGLALVVLAWLAFGARAVRLESQAEAVIDQARAGPISDAEAERAFERLDEAGELSPDQGPKIKYGELLEARGLHLEATLVAGTVIVDEPENLQAWFLSWIADPDAKRREAARKRLLQLNPWFSEVLRRAGQARSQ